VLLVEHPVPVRRALRESLLHEADIDVVGEASTIQRALRIAERLRPDAIVVDAEMDGLDPTAAVATLHARVPAAAVIVVAIEPDRLAQSFADDARVTVVGKIDGVTALSAALRRLRRT
jgi:two-component system response regulator DesR